MSKQTQERVLWAMRRIVVYGALAGAAVTGWNWASYDHAHAVSVGTSRP